MLAPSHLDPPGVTNTVLGLAEEKFFKVRSALIRGVISPSVLHMLGHAAVRSAVLPRSCSALAPSLGRRGPPAALTH